MEIDENEFLKSATTLPDCKEKFAPPPKLIEVMQAREGRSASAPRHLVEAGLEALTAGVALVTTLRAKDLVVVFGKDKVDEGLVKRMETAIAALQKALV